MHTPSASPADIAGLSLAALEFAVRVDSQSDESSQTIPSTASQRALAAAVAERLAGMGAAVETDEHANVIARLAGRGLGADKPPVAFMVHLDTSRGTQAVEGLEVLPGWDGSAIPYSENEALRVDVANYPEVADYVGQDVVFGPGRAPFGLDNKLGLAHVMTLASLLAQNPAIDHPPLLLVARPDEEIGRMAAVEGLAARFAAEGVPLGYTVDGLLPFEVNVENFNAARMSLWFEDEPLDRHDDETRAPHNAEPREPRDAESQSQSPDNAQALVRVHLGGVNTHGATAKAEGYRAATRLGAELVRWLEDRRLVPDRIVPVGFASDALRDCDAGTEWLVRGTGEEGIAEATRLLADGAKAIVAPHVPRGASWRVDAPVVIGRDDGKGEYSRATWRMLAWVERFMASEPGFLLLAEDSDGHDGYTNPYRALPAGGGVRLDLRLRDFGEAGLAGRADHVRHLAREADIRRVEYEPQYVNMGPRVAGHPELIAWPQAAAMAIGREAPVLPIRGGTGVDPFLDRGIPIANLGTGYFAPESEKEFTSLQSMAGHALWLVALVQILARELPVREAAG